jgi:hypothetical protein
MVYTLPADVDQRPVVIDGAGTLGRQIASVYAAGGSEVRIFDLSEEQREAARDYVEEHLAHTQQILGLHPARRGRVEVSDDLQEALAGGWMVIEAVPESIDIKTEVFGELDRLVEPDALAPLLPLVVGVLSVPMSLLLEVNAYYLGMLPILSEVAQQAGIPPEAMAKASLVGMYTVGFPLTPLTPSFFLLVGLAGVNIGAHIRHMLPWACLVSIVMLISAIILGQIPFPT